MVLWRSTWGPAPRGILRAPSRESYWKRVGPQPHAAHSAHRVESFMRSAWGPSPTRHTPRTELVGAVLLEGFFEILGDFRRHAPLDLPALEHEDELSVLEKADLRRGGRIAGEVAARLLRRLHVLSSEH